MCNDITPVEMFETRLMNPETAHGADLSIIVPTFNERDNVRELLKRLEACLRHVFWEVIFVDDDSPDGTADLVREIGMNDCRVRCLQRINRRGLSSACIEGMMSSAAPFLAVIDGDLQHDETLLPEMLSTLRDGKIDIVIGSRYIADGGVDDWCKIRTRLSLIATRLSRFVLRIRLTDPMSGFFMIRRETFHAAAHALSGLGYKILVDLLASSPRPLQFRELPYNFRSRQTGESKLDSRVVWDYLQLLIDKAIGHMIPVRNIALILITTIGALVHLLIFIMLFKGQLTGFLASEAIAVGAAITSNFALNKAITYRDMRPKGWRWFPSWASFMLVCCVGALGNIGLAAYFFSQGTAWTVSVLAGIVVGTAWNYAIARQSVP